MSTLTCMIMDDNPAQFAMEDLYLAFIAYQNAVINKQNQVNAFLTAKYIGVNNLYIYL